MTVKIYYDADCPPTLDDRIAVLGYGSQGHAHALNLKDSGADVRVGLYQGGRTREKAECRGLRVVDVQQAVREADIVTGLTPDVGQFSARDTQWQRGSHHDRDDPSQAEEPSDAASQCRRTDLGAQ